MSSWLETDLERVVDFVPCSRVENEQTLDEHEEDDVKKLSRSAKRRLRRQKREEQGPSEAIQVEQPQGRKKRTTWTPLSLQDLEKSSKPPLMDDHAGVFEFDEESEVASSLPNHLRSNGRFTASDVAWKFEEMNLASSMSSSYGEHFFPSSYKGSYEYQLSISYKPFDAADWLRQELLETLDNAPPLISIPRNQLIPGYPGTLTLPKRRWKNDGIQNLDHRHFTVMTYNILCPQYATTAKFSQTSPRHLDWNWRKVLLLDEIIYYSPDFICLQEVSPTEFNHFFFPTLQALGYDGLFQPKKRNNALDGCAIFYKTRFQLLSVQAFRYNELKLDDADARNRESFKRDLAVRVAPFDNVVLLAVFRNTHTNARIRIGTTHLHWSPDFADTKLVQACLLMDWLESLQQHPLILCGDFNSFGTDAVMKFIKSGSIDTTHFNGRDFGKFSQKPQVTHNLKLTEVYSEEDLPFTNLTPDFSAHLDHVFYTDVDLELIDCLVDVPENYLSSLTTLPNAWFPSDHLSLLACFRERREPNRGKQRFASPSQK